MKVIIIGTLASSFLGFRAELIKTLCKKNYTVYAFTSEYSKDELEKLEYLGAIPITYKLNRGGLNPLEDIKSTYSLANKIKKIEPDIVFSYFSKPVIFGSIAAKLARVPKIIGMLEGLGYTFTDQPEGLSSKTKIIKRIQILLYRIALPQLDQLIFLNPDDPKDLLQQYKIPVKKLKVLGGIGLDLEKYPHQPIINIKPPIHFLFIGRLLKEKGIHEFIAAIKIVKAQYPDTCFSVLGAIDHANMGALSQVELENLINSGLINYPGHVDNVSDWITASHVFVLPSYREGVPRSTQEAMAIGRAVITTDVPGCRETVIDGVNGFLVPKWNPKALAEKMIFFIENKKNIITMGEASYKIALDKFDSIKVNNKLLDYLIGD